MSVLRSVVLPDPVPPEFNNIFSPAHDLMRTRLRRTARRVGSTASRRARFKLTRSWRDHRSAGIRHDVPEAARARWEQVMVDDSP